jgi:hypothetical protein
VSILALGLVLGQVVVLAPSGYTGTLSVGDRTETRLRSVPLGGTAIDVETVPNVVLALNGRRTDFNVGYGPRVAYVDVLNDRTFILANSARIAAGFLATRQLRFDLTGEGSVGTQVTTGLVAPQALGAPPNAAQPAPFVAPNSVINSMSYRLTLGASQRISRDWGVQVSASYGGGKGLDAASRAVVPAYHGPVATASATYTASRRDNFTTRVRVSSTKIPSVGGEFSDASALELWSHSWSRRTTGSAGAGLTIFHNHPARNQPSVDGAFPAGEALVVHSIPLGRGEQLAFTGGSRLAVRYDPVLQTAQPQLGVSASSAWTSIHFGLVTTADAATTVPVEAGQLPARQVAGGVAVYHAPSPVIRIETGVRGYLQSIPAAAVLPTVPNTLQWTVFVALVIQAPVQEL